MKFFLVFILSFVFLLGDDTAIEDTNTSVSVVSEPVHDMEDNKTKVEDPVELIVVEDTSGMTNEQVREEAKKNDAKETKKKELNTAIDAMLKGDFDKVVDKQKTWEELSPTPKNYDWIQTKSGEWFKGYIKAMFDKKLEFDSDEIDMHTFKFKNVVQIKSYQVIAVNIDGVAIFEGIIRLRDDKITIIQGNNKFEFPKDDIISFAHSGKMETDKWYTKFTFSLDKRNGNTKQLDYSAQGIFKRRTAETKLVFDYFGRYSNVAGVETVNDHRVNEKFDIYITKNFYWTPIFGEFYQDRLKNIKVQATAGFGVGYMLINTNETELDLTVGPAFLYTGYLSVDNNGDKNIRSPSMEFSVRYENELTKDIDFTYDYRFSFTNKESGFYKHHMLAKLENEITKWLDIDFSYVWDYIDNPIKNASGKIPVKNDFQFLIGLGFEY